jgi:hypothetical protein
MAGLDIGMERRRAARPVACPEQQMVPHGITAGEASQAPTFAEVAGDLLQFINGAVVVAHNRVVRHADAGRRVRTPRRRCGVRPTVHPATGMLSAPTPHTHPALWATAAMHPESLDVPDTEP